MNGPPSSPPVSRAGPASAGLLPAFAPQASSSSQPGREFLRPKFAIYRDPSPQPTFLPTPIPTSEANAPASSSPPVSPARHEYRSSPPAEAKPLQTLIVARVPVSGASVTLGRSSKSSTFALRARNKLASRVHARLSVSQDNFVVIECLGWNGLTVSVPEESGTKKGYEVARGEILNVERMDGITIDVHGDKTLIEFNNDAEETEEELWKHSEHQQQEQQQQQQQEEKEHQHQHQHQHQLQLQLQLQPQQQQQQPQVGEFSDTSAQKRANEAYEEMPSKRRKQDDLVASPPMALSIADFSNTFSSNTAVTDNQSLRATTPLDLAPPVEQRAVLGAPLEVPASTKLEVPRPRAVDESAAGHKSSEGPELNVGFNTSTTKEVTPEPMAQSTSQLPNSVAQTPTASTEKRKKHQELSSEVRRELENVVVNFIAFSRLSAVPLATVRKASTQLLGLPKSQVRELIREIKCVGVTDAQRDDTGRLPEDEYYYIPEFDEDESRRTIVQTTRGHRSLRSCRKTRKQYFYRPLNLTE